MDSNSPLIYAGILFFLACSMLFSAFKAAIAAMDMPKTDKKATANSNSKEQRLSPMLLNRSRVLCALSIGGNFSKMAFAVLSALVFKSLFIPVGALFLSLIVFLLISIAGDILPAAYGKANSKKIALNIYGFVRFWDFLLLPVSAACVKMQNKIVSNNITHSQNQNSQPHILPSVQGLDNINLKDILTPRVNMVAIDINDEPKEIEQLVLNQSFSRIPVYEDSIDNIIGILLAKDYIRNIVEGRENNIRQMLAKPFFVHRKMTFLNLLSLFKNKKTNLMVVTDDYGGTLGLITIKDIVEELIGDIWDTDNEPPLSFVSLDDNRIEILGSYQLRDLAETHPEWQAYIFDEDFSTINGWAMNIFGHIPQNGATAVHNNLTLKVLQMDGNRIDILEISKENPAKTKYKNIYGEEQA